MNRCEEILNQVDSLPPLPDTALKLVKVINDPRATVEQIVEAIKYDPAVTSELLRLCNSAYFGLARRVSSLNEALLYLGTVKVMQLVMSIHTNALLGGSQPGYGLAPGVLWKHSVAVALASSLLTQRTGVPNVGLIFTAGLLHDIGKVVLNDYVAEEFAEIIRRVTEEQQAFLEAEHQVLGFDHQEIGAKIADRWKLPEPMVRCIRHHHDPAALEAPDPLVDTVYLANCICLLLGVGLGEDGLCYRADPAVMQRHGLHEQDLEVIGAKMLTELRHVEEIFADTSKTSPPRRAVAR